MKFLLLSVVATMLLGAIQALDIEKTRADLVDANLIPSVLAPFNAAGELGISYVNGVDIVNDATVPLHSLEETPLVTFSTLYPDIEYTFVALALNADRTKTTVQWIKTNISADKNDGMDVVPYTPPAHGGQVLYTLLGQPKKDIPATVFDQTEIEKNFKQFVKDNNFTVINVVYANAIADAPNEGPVKQTDPFADAINDIEGTDIPADSTDSAATGTESAVASKDSAVADTDSAAAPVARRDVEETQPQLASTEQVQELLAKVQEIDAMFRKSGILDSLLHTVDNLLDNVVGILDLGGSSSGRSRNRNNDYDEDEEPAPVPRRKKSKGGKSVDQDIAARLQRLDFMLKGGPNIIEQIFNGIKAILDAIKNIQNLTNLTKLIPAPADPLKLLNLFKKVQLVKGRLNESSGDLHASSETVNGFQVIDNALLSDDASDVLVEAIDRMMTAVELLLDSEDQFKSADFVTGITQGLKDSVGGVAIVGHDLISGVTQILGDIFGAIFDPLGTTNNRNNVGGLDTGFQSSDVSNGLGQVVSGVANGVGEVITGTLDGVESPLGVGDSAKDTTVIVKDGSAAADSSVDTVVKDNGAVTGGETVVNGAPQEGTFTFVKGEGDEGYQVIKSDGVSDGLGQVVDGVVDGVGKVVTGTLDGVESVLGVGDSTKDTTVIVKDGSVADSGADTVVKDNGAVNGEKTVVYSGGAPQEGTSVNGEKTFVYSAPQEDTSVKGKDTANNESNQVIKSDGIVDGLGKVLGSVVDGTETLVDGVTDGVGNLVNNDEEAKKNDTPLIMPAEEEAEGAVTNINDSNNTPPIVPAEEEAKDAVPNIKDSVSEIGAPEDKEQSNLGRILR